MCIRVSFTGNPMAKHLANPTIGESHFQHLPVLFYAPLRDVAPSEGAVALVGARARMIAESLLTGIAVHRDRDPDITRRMVLPHV